MRSYESKSNLVETIKQKYKLYRQEFDNIPEDLKDQKVEGIDKSPSENVAYQIGWISLLISWDEKEKSGEDVVTPTKEYKWNNLGGLYQSFYEEYAHYSLNEEISILDDRVDELCLWIDSLTEEELFDAGQRKWATTKAQWPLWKWIHINTVAPFTTFRAQIRKWKKEVPSIN